MVAICGVLAEPQSDGVQDCAPDQEEAEREGFVLEVVLPEMGDPGEGEEDGDGGGDAFRGGVEVK